MKKQSKYRKYINIAKYGNKSNKECDASSPKSDCIQPQSLQHPNKCTKNKLLHPQ